MARNDEEPAKTGSAGAARWSDYLDWVRGELVRGVLGLTEDQQRTARVPSGWTPLELLNHVLHMEQRWFVWGFLGEPVDAPWGDWDVDEPWRDDADGRWALGAVHPDEVLAEPGVTEGSPSHWNTLRALRVLEWYSSND